MYFVFCILYFNNSDDYRMEHTQQQTKNNEQQTKIEIFDYAWENLCQKTVKLINYLITEGVFK